jgi:hypothetical protein
MPPQVSGRSNPLCAEAESDGKCIMKKPLYSGEATPASKINFKNTLSLKLVL